MDPLETETMMDQNSEECCFAHLRRLAVNVDKGVREVQSRMDNCDYGVDQHSDETNALLFLQHSSKDIKDMSSGVKKIRKDFELRSSTINHVNELFSRALESFTERLETVEAFIENYGYQRPLPTPPSPTPIVQTDQSSCNAETDGDFALTGDNHEKENINPSADDSDTDLSNPRTPRLEDIGLSEHTLFDLKMGKFKTLDSDSTTPIRKIKEKPQVSDCRMEEVLTPKLESYGMSEHTLMFITNVTRDDESKKKENICVEEKALVTRLRTDSPKTPPLPELTTHFFMDPPKIEIPVTESRKCYSPRTPPLPEFQTRVFTESDLPKAPHKIENKKVHTSLDFTDKTPPFPKLSSKYV